MGSYTITKNTQLVINLPEDFTIQGWVVSQGTAIHSGCNAGYISLDYDLSSNTSWTFRYNIISLTSGTINIVVDGINGQIINAPGEYETTFNVTGTTRIQFYATGDVSVQVLQVYAPAQVREGLTLAFNEDADRWVTYYSYIPEFMNKFMNSFFTFENGRMWEHNVNEIRNNFYGVQYSSSVTFICNIEFRKNKLWFNLRLDSTGGWFSPDMETDKTDQFPNGMKSRLKKGNFKSIDGKLWADIMNDMTDPKFNTIVDPVERQIQALFKGRKLQGGYMTIQLENNDTKPVKLSSVEVYYIEAERNF